GKPGCAHLRIPHLAPACRARSALSGADRTGRCRCGRIADGGQTWIFPIIRDILTSAAAMIELLLTLLDEAYDKRSWHGPNLRGSLRGVAAQEAAWRPRPDAHNIWEIAVHAAYWKYVVWRRVTGNKRGTFALKGSNFFPRPVELSEAAWK